jgi:hypothetical protein
MAILIFGRSGCALCGEVLNQDDDIVATSHFIHDETSPLWRFSDSGMHRLCFSSWELKSDFIQTYNNVVGPMTWGDGSYKFMSQDGTIHKLFRNQSNGNAGQGGGDNSAALSASPGSLGGVTHMTSSRFISYALRLVFMVLGWLTAAFLVSAVWWRLWLYDCLPGASGVLSRMRQADGEGAYDAMAHEMFFICAGVLAAAAIGVRWWLRRRRGSATSFSKCGVNNDQVAE